MSKVRSGAQRGQDNVAAFESYVESLRSRGESLPRTAKGDVNLSKVAEDSGVGDRGRFYTNDKLKAALANATANLPQVASAPVALVTESAPIAPDASGDSLRRAERRAQRLEQQNAALVAENAELRRQLRDLRLQLGREDMVLETGRRVPPPRKR